MKTDQKLLKSFFILKNKTEYFDDSWLMDWKFSKDDNIGKIIKTSSNIGNSLTQVEIVWEKNKAIISEEINEEGLIVESTQNVKSVNKLLLWYFENTPFLIAFSDKLTIIKDFLNMVYIPYLDFQPLCVKYKNEFYVDLLDKKAECEVSQIEYQSSSNNQRYIFSGTDVGQNINLDKYNQINSITVSFFKTYGLKAKINKNGKIVLYNLPFYYDVIDFVEILKEIISEKRDEGLSYESIS